jgi:hypothetical protein
MAGPAIVGTLFELLRQGEDGKPLLDDEGARLLGEALSALEGLALVDGVKGLVRAAMMLEQSHGARETADRILDVADRATPLLAKVAGNADRAFASRKHAAAARLGRHEAANAPKVGERVPAGTLKAGALTPPRVR